MRAMSWWCVVPLLTARMDSLAVAVSLLRTNYPRSSTSGADFTCVGRCFEQVVALQLAK
jgi:hypothetical protein